MQEKALRQEKIRKESEMTYAGDWMNKAIHTTVQRKMNFYAYNYEYLYLLFYKPYAIVYTITEKDLFQTDRQMTKAGTEKGKEESGGKI